MNNIVGKSVTRVDAYAKVTGEAKYTSDLEPRDCLCARVVHSTIANGLVKRFDLEDALKVPGVVKIVTCFDVPDYQFPTAGHPWSVEAAHQDIGDRKLLNQRVRLYGDDIAAVIIKQGNKYGVKIHSEAPSIHMIRANIETEIAPIVGSEQQANDLVNYIKDASATEEGVWGTNIFGKSIEELVTDGMRNKIVAINDESQSKLQDTMQKIVNDSNGGMVCIII